MNFCSILRLLLRPSSTLDKVDLSGTCQVEHGRWKCEPATDSTIHLIPKKHFHEFLETLKYQLHIL